MTAGGIHRLIRSFRLICALKGAVARPAKSESPVLNLKGLKPAAHVVRRFGLWSLSELIELRNTSRRERAVNYRKLVDRSIEDVSPMGAARARIGHEIGPNGVVRAENRVEVRVTE